MPTFIIVRDLGLYDTLWALLVYPFFQRYFIKGATLGPSSREQARGWRA